MLMLMGDDDGDSYVMGVVIDDSERDGNGDYDDDIV